MAAQNKKDANNGKRKGKASPKRKRYNTRLIKATMAYTVPEIAVLLNVHKNAVLRWPGEGLGMDKEKRPYLVRGDELIRFLSARQQKKRHKCAVNELFCFKCHAPRRAYLGIADVVIISPSRFRVKAICETCDTPLNKAQGIRNLQKIQECFHVQKIEGQHIIERIDPIVNSDLEAHP